MAKRTHQPMRMCVVTRQLCHPENLLRVVVDPRDTGRIIPDPRRVLPGRGAWMIPTPENYEQAVKRRAFARALRVSASVDTRPVGEYMNRLAAGIDHTQASSESGIATRAYGEERHEH